MSTHTTLASRIGSRVARWLVMGPMPSLVLIGSVAVAGFSAKALTAASASHGRPLTPASGVCGPAYDGAGQMHVYACGPA